MLVSSIQLTSPGRFKIILEDGEEIRSTLSAVTDLRLFSGKELNEDELEDVKLQSIRALSRERALEMVSRRQLSHRELMEKLMHKGADEDTARYCADWLQERGFINDENYAAAIVRHYAARGYGLSRVKCELMRRGIPRELTENALEDMPEQDSKIDKFISSRLKDPEDSDEIRKISAALYRRGYSWAEIRSAFSRLDTEIED